MFTIPITTGDANETNFPLQVMKSFVKVFELNYNLAKNFWVLYFLEILNFHKQGIPSVSTRKNIK